SKGTNFLAVNSQRADQIVLLQHWNSYKRSDTSEFNGRSDVWITLFNVCRQCGRVGAMHYCPCRHHTGKWKVRLEQQRLALAIFGERGRRIVGRNKMQSVAIPTEDIAEVSVTNPRSILQHGCENRLQITRRATDDVKDLGRGSLLL